MFRKIWNAILELLGFVNGSANKPKNSVGTASPKSTKYPCLTKTPEQGVQQNSPRNLYAGKGHEITDQHVREASKDLFWTDSGTKMGPTPAQQKVIFNGLAATAVLAGAGSGKSTTLVSRVLFLHKQLGVSFQTMAVFTFTRKSRQDFIDKLLKEAKRWNVRLSDAGAKRLVRTFHSKALQVARDLIGPEERIFEFLGKEQRARDKKHMDNYQTPENPDDEQISPDEEEANQIEGLARLDDRSPEQAEIFRDVYAECYGHDEEFRKAIATLFDYTMTTGKLPADEKSNKQMSYINRMKKIDADLCAHLEERWQQQGRWPIPGITARNKDGSRFCLDIMGTPLFANGYIETLGIYVVLGSYDGISNNQITVGTSKIKPEFEVKNKRLVLLVGCKNKIRYVNNSDDAEELRQQLELHGGEKGLAAPLIKLRLPGELTSEVAYFALYTFGVFVENLGLHPDKLADHRLTADFSEVERATIYAVSRFFSGFYSRLKSKGMVTFNQIFFRLGEGSKDLERIGIGSLVGITHLMIDEFQDVSPLIVKFVLGLHGELVRKSEGQLTPTLMCVGDDWQSIYGWRGSSPHFLLNFHRFFHGAPSEHICLEDNFRSSQKIIDCGESFIKLVQAKSKKQGIASNEKVKDLPWIVGAVEDYKSEDVLSALQRLLDLADQDDDIYLLAATNMQLRPFGHISDSRLTATTFHQSKGLEAEYVVLVGARGYFGSNKLKNFIYKLADFPQTFDEAQRDEAFRVAYVAATRAKKLCLWFARPRASDVISSVPADGIIRKLITSEEVIPYIEASF